MAATAAKLVARAARPLVGRWRAWWDVDHRAANFYTPQEYDEVAERQQEQWDEAVKAKAIGHMKAHVLPRVSIDLSRGAEAFKLKPREEPLEGDLYEK